GIVEASPQEIDFIERVAAAVKPCVDAPSVRPVRREGRWNDQTVRLHATIDFRNVRAHDEASLARPRRIAVRKLIGPFHADAQQLLRVKDLLFPKEFVAVQSEAYRF